ncbi:MAG: DMT family transporter [Anaerolineae bacterium]
MFRLNKETRTTLVSMALLSSAAMLWAGNFVVGRFLRGDLPPVSLSYWRWVLALLILLPLDFGQIRRYRKLILAEWKLIGAIGAVGFAAYPVFVYQALTTTTALNALLMLATVPLLIALAAWIVMRERVTGQQVCGMVLSLVGAAVVLSHGDIDVLRRLQLNQGDLWMAAAVPLWAAYAVLIERRPRQLPPRTMLTASVVAGVILLTPVYLWQVAHGERISLTTPNLLGLLYVAVFVSALGFMLWNQGVVGLDPNQAGAFVNLIPVFGALLSIVFLGEQVALYHLVAAGLVFGGIVLSSRFVMPKRPAEAEYAPVMKRL